MKVAVCVKEVPDASAPKRLDPQTFRLDRGVAGALNEFDTHAIEEGLQLKDKGGEGEVVAVLMGPERAADSLRKALAIGAEAMLASALAGGQAQQSKFALARRYLDTALEGGVTSPGLLRAQEDRKSVV